MQQQLEEERLEPSRREQLLPALLLRCHLFHLQIIELRGAMHVRAGASGMLYLHSCVRLMGSNNMSDLMEKESERAMNMQWKVWLEVIQ